jgi:hypothetical protein
LLTYDDSIVAMHTIYGVFDNYDVCLFLGQEGIVGIEGASGKPRAASGFISPPVGPGKPFVGELLNRAKIRCFFGF